VVLGTSGNNGGGAEPTLEVKTVAAASDDSSTSLPSWKLTWMVRLLSRNRMACFVRSQFLTWGRCGSPAAAALDVAAQNEFESKV